MSNKQSLETRHRNLVIQYENVIAKLKKVEEDNKKLRQENKDLKQAIKEAKEEFENMPINSVQLNMQEFDEEENTRLLNEMFAVDDDDIPLGCLEDEWFDDDTLDDVFDDKLNEKLASTYQEETWDEQEFYYYR